MNDTKTHGIRFEEDLDTWALPDTALPQDRREPPAIPRVAPVADTVGDRPATPGSTGMPSPGLKRRATTVAVRPVAKAPAGPAPRRPRLVMLGVPIAALFAVGVIWTAVLGSHQQRAANHVLGEAPAARGLQRGPATSSLAYASTGQVAPVSAVVRLPPANPVAPVGAIPSTAQTPDPAPPPFSLTVMAPKRTAAPLVVSPGSAAAGVCAVGVPGK